MGIPTWPRIVSQRGGSTLATYLVYAKLPTGGPSRLIARFLCVISTDGVHRQGAGYPPCLFPGLVSLRSAPCGRSAPR